MKRILFTLFIMTSLSAQAQKPDSLRMDSIIHNLPDIVVKGERPIAKVKGSTITYDLPRLIEKKAVDNVYEAIKEIPGVTLSDEQIQLGGRNATIILDGKVTTMTAEEITTLLKSLPASKIDKAEVMYNAPAKMQVRGSLINIKLKHGTNGNSPIQGEMNLAWNQDYNARFGERATLLYNKGKFSMDVMYLYSHGDSYKITDEQSHHSLDDGSIHDIDTHETANTSGYGHTYRIGMDYNFSENHQISLVYNGDYEKKDIHENLTGNVSGITNINYRTWLHNLRMDYHTPFGFSVGAEMTYYHNPETQFLSSELPTGKLDYNVDNNQKINRWKFFLSQEHALKNGWGINYGTIYTTSINHSRQIYTAINTTTGDSPASSYTRQREDDVNIYFGFNKTFSKKLSMEASAAAEYYHSPAWHQWHFYPTLNLTYLPTAGNVFQLSLSSDRNYPDYWTMTNFITYSNGGYNEIIGNPSLKPSSEYQLQLVYILKSKYQFVAWFNHHDDYFVQTPYQRHDRLVVNYQYLNLDFQQQLGFQSVVPFSISNWLDSRLTLIGVWQRDKSNLFYDIPFDRHVIYGMAQIHNIITLSTKPDLTLSIDGMMRSKAIQATFNLPASSNLDISTRWQFWNKRAILKAYCNDIFETSSINPRINYQGQNLRMDFSSYREFGISFTYKFGGFKEKVREKVDTSRFHY
jgi:hypothetical protein